MILLGRACSRAPNNFGQIVTFLTCTPEVRISNLDENSDFSESNFSREIIIFFSRHKNV